MLNSEFWAQYFKVYDVLNWIPMYRELMDSICREIDPKPGSLVLDAGSGTGNLTMRLKRLGCEVVAIDFCEEALCRHTAKDADCCVLLADLTRGLPFKNECFDGVACNNVLYTLPACDQVKAAKEFRRVLKPGGKAALANPKAGWKPMAAYLKIISSGIRDEGWWRTIKNLVRGMVPTFKMFYYNGKLRREQEYHYFEFEEQRLLLEAGGFVDISDTVLVYANQVVLNSGFKVTSGAPHATVAAGERSAAVAEASLAVPEPKLPLMLFPSMDRDGDGELVIEGDSTEASPTNC
jgi:ubiquinone/menaquinone biosynthesis C-methylase UbiE